MNKLEEKVIEDSEFELIIKEIKQNPHVQEMNLYRQHFDTNCFDHCLNVSYYSYLICKKYNLDYIAVARAGMLHDLFLYDWRKKRSDGKKLHAFRHPKKALSNANKLFELTDKEQDIILKHMWPLTVVLPRYKESYVLSFVDKYCALKESIDSYKNKYILQKVFRYAYLFACMIIIKIM